MLNARGLSKSFWRVVVAVRVRGSRRKEEKGVTSEPHHPPLIVTPTHTGRQTRSRESTVRAERKPKKARV